jgi:hypothetical protein
MKLPKLRVGKLVGSPLFLPLALVLIGLLLIGMGVFSYSDRFNPNPSSSESSIEVIPFSSVTFTYADGTSQTIDNNAASIIPFTPATVYRSATPPFVSMTSVTFTCGLSVTATASSTLAPPPAWNPTVSFQWKVDTLYGVSGSMSVKRSSPSSGTTAGSITILPNTGGAGQVVFKTETVTAAEIESWTTTTGPYYVKVAVVAKSITAPDPNGNTISGPECNYNNQVQIAVDKIGYSLTPSSVTSYTFATIIKPASFLNLPASIFGMDSLDIAGFSIPIEYILIGLGLLFLLLPLLMSRRGR